VAEQVLLGLQTMHNEHFIHADLKPSNILVNSEGHVKISDFGTTHQEHKIVKDQGTLQFMAPERLGNGVHNVKLKRTRAVDVWSLGLTVAYCCTGTVDLPTSELELWAKLKTPDPLDILGEECEVSHACRDFIAQCVVKEADARPSVAELLLHPFIGHRGGDQAAEATQQRFAAHCKAHEGRDVKDLEVVAQALVRQTQERGGKVPTSEEYAKVAQQIRQPVDVVEKECQRVLALCDKANHKDKLHCLVFHSSLAQAEDLPSPTALPGGVDIGPGERADNMDEMFSPRWG
jgi:hypothetical protein